MENLIVLKTEGTQPEILYVSPPYVEGDLAPLPVTVLRNHIIKRLPKIARRQEIKDNTNRVIRKKHVGEAVQLAKKIKAVVAPPQAVNPRRIRSKVEKPISTPKPLRVKSTAKIIPNESTLKATRVKPVFLKGNK